MFRLLVVEDDKNMQKFMNAVLRAEGYQVFLADNGEQALQILDKQHIDLMITDIMMSGMDGYTLTEELRDAGWQIPILMVTARETVKDRRKGFFGWN